jgi:uncharacterized membrane protein
MRLYDDYRTILRKAWSVRFMALAAIMTGCEAIVTVTGVDWVPLPHGARLVLLFVVIVAAFVSRLVAQKDV